MRKLYLRPDRPIDIVRYESCAGAELITMEAVESSTFFPGTVSKTQIDGFVEAIRDVVDIMHNSTSFWTEALGLARRVASHV